MREGLATGYTVPQAVLEGRDQPLAAIAGAADPSRHAVLAAVRRLPGRRRRGGASALQDEARRVISQQVLPAYGELLTFMREVYVPGARKTTAACDLPDGDAFYAAQIRHYTTLPLSADAIHERGLREVARILAEMHRSRRGAGFDGDLPAFLHFLRTDPQFYARTPQELLAQASWISKRIDGLLPKFFGVLPRQPYGVAPVPDDIAPFYTTGRYVPAPQPAGCAGTYWVNTLRPAVAPALHAARADPARGGAGPSPADRAGGRAAATSRRSGATASSTPTARAGRCTPSTWATRWACTSTPYEQFGRLTYEMWRAARLVVDTGLHAQALEPRGRARLPARAHGAQRARGRHRGRPLHQLAGPGAVVQDRRDHDPRAARARRAARWARASTCVHSMTPCSRLGSVPLGVLEAASRRLDLGSPGCLILQPGNAPSMLIRLASASPSPACSPPRAAAHAQASAPAAAASAPKVRTAADIVREAPASAWRRPDPNDVLRDDAALGHRLDRARPALRAAARGKHPHAGRAALLRRPGGAARAGQLRRAMGRPRGRRRGRDQGPVAGRRQADAAARVLDQRPGPAIAG